MQGGFDRSGGRPISEDAGSFQVDWTHRLLTTRDALSPSSSVLSDLLPDSEGPVRMVAILDQGLVDAHPELTTQIQMWAEANTRSVRLASDILIVPGGEQAKNGFEAFNDSAKAINDCGICRKSFVLAAGGGAVLDAVGYAAASAHRGVRMIRMPSTTLAQADAGIGVKNGINAFGKKNFLGTFSPPWAVINDTNLLRSLPDRHWRSGLSESVKVALLKDPDFFDELQRLAIKVRRRDLDAMERIVHRTAQLHLEHIVHGGDPFELTTARPLDFGHWSAHKLEQITDFELAHGEAVAIGLIIDLTYAALTGRIPEAILRSTRRCLIDLGFDLDHPALEDHEALLEGLWEFREHLGGRLTITFIEAVGQPLDVHEIDLSTMRQALTEVRRAAVNESSRAG